MGTNVTYNGVTLHNVLTRQFEQQPVYDQSGTDVIHHRFIVRVDSLLTPSALLALNPIGAIPPGASASDVVMAITRRIHRLLSQNRGTFIYTLNGEELLHVDPCLTASQAADCNNGPRVVSLDIIHVSPVTIRISFAVELALQACVQDTQTVVISNRWSSIDDIDEDFRVTRTWRGVLRLKQAARNLHDFRGIVVPPLLRGWKRLQMHFTAEANALEMAYQIVDRQMLGVAPPHPATKMRCTHSEHLLNTGMRFEAETTIRLDGPRDADKKALLQRAIQIIDAKLELENTKKDRTLLEMTAIDYCDENTNAVEVRARILRVAQSPREGMLNLELFGEPLQLPNYNPDIAVLKDGYAGVDLANLFSCYLQSPCVSLHGYLEQQPNQEQGEGGQDQTAAKPVRTYTQGPATDQITPVSYSQPHLEAIYTYFRMESILERFENRAALPIARHSGSSGVNTVHMIRLAPATARRRIKMAAERIGSWPVLWKPEDFTVAGFTHNILWSDFNHRPPELSGDGRQLFAIDAEYLYALNRAPGPDEALPVGAMFWDSTAVANNTFNSQHYISPTGEKGLG